jgi:hypothetical protein
MSTLKVNKIENTATSDGGIAIDSTGHVQLDGVQLPTTGQLSGRRINHNGAMQIAQRGTSFTGVNSTAYHCDRHELYFQNSSAAFTVTQATDTPDGFGASLKIDVTTADTSTASNEEIKLTHKIEGFDLQRTAKGTSAAEQLTLSFYVKATKTGTYVVELFDRDNTRDISASYTVSDTNWNRYTLTFPADTAGSAFNNDNASSLEINWWLVAGSAVQGGSLNTTWRASSDGSSATGQVNFADSTDNDWLITGIQLEVGAKATPFEHRSFGDELQRCLRYFQYYTTNNTTAAYAGMGIAAGSASARFYFALIAAMRTVPSVTASSCSADDQQASTYTLSSPSIASGTIGSLFLSFSTSGMTGGRPIQLVIADGGHISLSAEL